MASSRDDFIIAIRSAFLKKSTQQKFSLLTLVFISIFIILLSSLDFKAVRYLKAGLSEVVYRSSFIVSIPENFVRNSFINIIEYTTFFNKAPPPVKVSPISTKSADNSGGVLSNASLIPFTISFKIIFNASAVSSSVILTYFGVPDLRSRPLTA